MFLLCFKNAVTNIITFFLILSRTFHGPLTIRLLHLPIDPALPERSSTQTWIVFSIKRIQNIHFLRGISNTFKKYFIKKFFSMLWSFIHLSAIHIVCIDFDRRPTNHYCIVIKLFYIVFFFA